MFPAEHMELNNQLHILPHGGGIIAAGLDDQLLLEQAEGAGDDNIPVEFVKQDAGGQEGPVIFQHLHAGQQLFGHAVADDASGFNFRTVAGAHRTAHRHHLGVLQQRAHNFVQGVALQDGVRVDADKVGVGSHIDPHVQRVRLSAVFLGDQRDGDLPCAGFVYRLSRPAGNPALNGPVDRLQAEGVPKDLDGVVGGAVIHHNDLIELIVQCQKGSDGSPARRCGRPGA